MPRPGRTWGAKVLQGREMHRSYPPPPCSLGCFPLKEHVDVFATGAGGGRQAQLLAVLRDWGDTTLMLIAAKSARTGGAKIPSLILSKDFIDQGLC